MRLSPYTFDAHEINDTSNYVAKIPYETPLQATQASPLFVSRAGATPVYAGKDFPYSTITLSITCKGTVRDQLETLNQWFNVYDETAKKLIVKDLDDSSKQYYIYCTPITISPINGTRNVKVTLARKDAVWQTETQNSSTWPITISGDNTAVVNGGNIEAYPYLEFKPTSYPTGGFLYERHVSFVVNSSYPYPNRPIEVLGGIDTAALVANASVSNAINEAGGINDSVDTWSIDTSVGDGLPTGGGMFYMGTEQCSYTSIAAGEIIGVTRGINGTTAAAHADDVVMYQSLTQADGDDWRVLVNGVEVDRWFGDSGTAIFNSSATKCWIALDVPAKREATLKTAIADSGTPSAIELNMTAANKIAIIAMPATGFVIIDSEEFAYTSKTITTSALKLNLGTRTLRNTVIAAHAANATVKWCPYQISVVYGSQGASTPVIDSTKKPVINLATSTNASFVYATFLDTTDPIGRRAGSWKPTIISTTGRALSLSDVYYGDNAAADTDPSQVMGMKIAAFLSGVWLAETADIVFTGAFPDAVSEVTSTGYKYRYATSWPTIARLFSSATGVKWIGEWATEATPSTVQVWEAWTHNTEAIPNTSRWLRYQFKGRVLGSDSNYSAFEVSSATITLVNYPTVSLRAAVSNYYIVATVTNTTSGDYITIQSPMQINQTLYIECDPNNPYAKFNGQIINVVKPDTNRSNWLPLDPGSNTLTFTQASDNNITCTVKWRDRMNFG